MSPHTSKKVDCELNVPKTFFQPKCQLDLYNPRFFLYSLIIYIEIYFDDKLYALFCFQFNFFLFKITKIFHIDERFVIWLNMKLL